MKTRFLIVLTSFLFFHCDKKERTFYQSGELESEFSLLNGKKNGPFKFYFPTGETKLEGEYLEEKIDGELVRYYKEGQIFSRSIYQKGILTDTAKYYFKNGRIKEYEIWNNNGLLIDAFFFDSLGNFDTAIDKKFLIVQPWRDTIVVGNHYRATIKIAQREFNVVDIVLSKSQRDVTGLQSISKNRLVKLDSITSEIIIKGESVGLDSIVGFIVESGLLDSSSVYLKGMSDSIKNLDDWRIQNVRSFSKEFFVKDSI